MGGARKLGSKVNRFDIPSFFPKERRLCGGRGDTGFGGVLQRSSIGPFTSLPSFRQVLRMPLLFQQGAVDCVFLDWMVSVLSYASFSTPTIILQPA